MKTVLQYLGIAALGLLAGAILASSLQWKGCGGPQSDTTTVSVPIVPPPVEVTPNPAPAVVERSDPILLRRVDSLLQAQARERSAGLAREESLQVVMAWQDSLLRVRSLPSRSEQRVEAIDPLGLRITGNLKVIHEPLTMTNLARLYLDTVQVPVKIIHDTQVVTETNPYLVIGGVVVGALIGGYTVSRIK